MAISKRLRFEILRRDNHACRYCGQCAPAVRITVDHVVPESLGGSDDPTNLVAACADCNSGKSSVAPDSAVVADVAADALRYARALAQAVEERWHERTMMECEVEAFNEEWLRWHTADRRAIPRPDDWGLTVGRWIAGGLDLEELFDKIPLAMKKPADQTWRYFCGIAWNMLGELQARARQIAAFEHDDQPKTVCADEIIAQWVA